jgi:tRNA(Ile)-lysidine synthase
MTKNKLLRRTWQNLVKFERENSFFESRRVVLAGLSGGPDSVALLHFLKQISAKRGFTLIAVHINHGLRRSAGKDADFSKKFAKSLRVKFISRRAAVKKLAAKENLSIEHAARKARYKIFGELAKKHKAAALALAHHGDDNAETVILNILRGTKAKGLLGIPPRRRFGGLNIVRPFLCVTKGEILNYLKEHNLSFVKDETNEQDIYTRNWVRKKLLPLLESKQPQIRRHLLLMARDLGHYIKTPP